MARTIVIADDNEVNRRALRAHLRKDFNVLEIQDRAELFTILEKNRALVSAVLVSTMSTVINGYKILEEIRAVPDYRSIPIILITANDKIETIKKTVESGANGILTKPFDFDLLKKNLENAISICENASLVNVLSRDKLTGLLCPELFFSECDKLIQNHEPGFYTMSCLDIEHFKVINDQYGMNTGDEVLKHVADCIRSCCDEVEGLGCRFSADRFAVLYPRALINSSLVLKGYQRAAEPPCINNTIRIRVGRYLIKDKAIPANIIFERATVAEESIKGRYDLLVAEYSDSMRDRLLYEQKIINDMNRALIEGQFIPYLQPQYNHATGAIIGAEALVRWKKDEKLISPVEFVPIFEKNGFIYEVDKDMWEKICILLRKWLDEGKHPLPISVNISRLDFFKDDFYDTICGLVNKYRIPTDLLRLEVTESAFTDSAQHVVGTVNRLIHHGLRKHYECQTTHF